MKNGSVPLDVTYYTINLSGLTISGIQSDTQSLQIAIEQATGGGTAEISFDFVGITAAQETELDNGVAPTGLFSELTATPAVFSAPAAGTGAASTGLQTSTNAALQTAVVSALTAGYPYLLVGASNSGTGSPLALSIAAGANTPDPSPGEGVLASAGTFDSFGNGVGLAANAAVTYYVFDIAGLTAADATALSNNTETLDAGGITANGGGSTTLNIAGVGASAATEADLSAGIAPSGLYSALTASGLTAETTATVTSFAASGASVTNGLIAAIDADDPYFVIGLQASFGFTIADINLAISCFAAGTRIATGSGEERVERLRAGDLVRTASGRLRPITWVGSGRALITPANRGRLAPVIVRAGALGPGVPRRDLCVTRDHALKVAGPVLVPAQHLVNGRSIVSDERSRVLAYFHVELDDHDILIAEGAPAESFRDDGSAVLFHNAGTRPATAIARPPCLPLITEGAALADAWSRIAARAGVVGAVSEEADLHLIADGVRIDAERIAADGPVTFRLATRPDELLLASRSVIPAALGMGADLRRLGVAVASVRFEQAGRRITYLATSPALCRGFYDVETDLHRWMTGLAVLPVPRLAPGPLTTAVKIAAGLRYWVARAA